MENFELENNGLIYEVSDNDYMFGSDNLEIKQNLNTIRHEYNQSQQTRTRNACVLYANAGCISDLTGYKFSNEELLEIVDLAEKSYKWNEGSGMHFARGTDCLRNWWNTKFPNDQIMSFRLDIGSDTFYEALDKGHSLTVGYKTSKDYLIDSQNDGVVQGVDFPKGGGHLVRVHGSKTSQFITDNYIGKKIYNTYNNNNLVELQKNGVFYLATYLFLRKKTMSEQIKDNMSLENSKKFFDRGYTNGLNPKVPITREEMWATLEVILEKNNLK